MPYNVLHTSDWHLGCRLLGKDREAEHIEALDKLLQLVETENVNLLIVSGDIFDTGAPPNSARKLYYAFFRKLIRTCCEHIVVIGGNHDSPSMLEAPADILEMLQIHVIGSAQSDSSGNTNFLREVIEIKNENGDIVAVVGAVPFLRDRDIMKSVAGQSFTDKIKQMREGLNLHYKEIASLLSNYKNVPKIVTGHLFAQNSLLSGNAEKQDGENDIHIGNLAKVDMSDFKNSFSYIALGHIHKPQTIASSENIRYSGSLIQMGFSERDDAKSAVLVSFESEKLSGIRTLPLPKTRDIIRFKGSKDTIVASLNNYANPYRPEAWGELVLTESCTPTEVDEIKELAKEKRMDILKYSFDIKRNSEDALHKNTVNKKLEDVSVEEILAMMCKEGGKSETQTEEILQTFSALKDIEDNRNKQ